MPQGVKARADFFQLGRQIFLGLFAQQLARVAASEVLKVGAFNFGDDIGQAFEGVHGLFVMGQTAEGGQGFHAHGRGADVLQPGGQGRFADEHVVTLVGCEVVFGPQGGEVHDFGQGFIGRKLPVDAGVQVLGFGEQLGEVKAHVVLEGDAQDAQGAAAQGVRVGRAGGDHVQAEAAHHGVGFVGHGQDSAGQGFGSGRIRAGGEVLLAQGLDHSLVLAAVAGVNAAHNALQGAKLAHHARTEIGLGQATGPGHFLMLRVFDLLGQPGAQLFQAAALVAHAAQGRQKNNVIQALGPGVQARAQVCFPEEIGVFQAGGEHPFPAGLHGFQVRRGHIQHGDEVGQKLAILAFHAKAFLVGFHAGEQHLAGQFQVFGGHGGQHGHRVLGKPLHLGEQAVLPNHVAVNAFGQFFSFGHDVAAAFGGGENDFALIADDTQVVGGRGHFQPSGAVHPVAVSMAAAGHTGHAEGNDLIIQKRHEPAQGAGV